MLKTSKILNLDGVLFLQNKQELKKQYNIYKLIAGMVGTCFLLVSTIYEDIVLKYEINSLDLIFICIIFLGLLSCLDYSIYWMKRKKWGHYKKRHYKYYYNKYNRNNFNNNKNNRNFHTNKPKKFLFWEDVNWNPKETVTNDNIDPEFTESTYKNISDKMSIKKIDYEFISHPKVGKVYYNEKEGTYEFHSRFITHSEKYGNINLSNKGTKNSLNLSKVEKIDKFKSHESLKRNVGKYEIDLRNVSKNKDVIKSIENYYGDKHSSSIDAEPIIKLDIFD